MAQFTVTTGKITLTASATKSLILLDPVTNEAVLSQISISLDGSAAATGVQIDLYRATTYGSPAGTTGMGNKLDPITQAATTTALTALTTEPTTVAVLDSWMVQPFGGLLVVQFPLGREPKMQAATANTALGIRYTTASGVTPDCVATLYFVE